jgi:hypothetical protein
MSYQGPIQGSESNQLPPGPPYNATNFTPANAVIYNTLQSYAHTQPQYPLGTGYNSDDVSRNTQNISYFSGLNQQTQQIKTMNDAITAANAVSKKKQGVKGNIKTQSERIMYLQAQTLTAARNQMTGQNPSLPAGVLCATIYGIINS